MKDMTIAQMGKALSQGDFSSEELTRELLGQIRSQDQSLKSFITVTDEEAALQQAKAADTRRKSGDASFWTGIPIAHKDIFCTEGQRTTAGSKMLENFVPPYDSTVARKFREAGSLCLGKTNMDEFAMGSSSESSFFGATSNPWDHKRVPGGSSGGSAAAVAAGLVPAATGTDTGGSIRQPAALCGITGLKPTYGRVSRYGMIAYASSLDQGGPMARTAEDCALMLNLMAGHDPQDSTSMKLEVPDYTHGLDQSLSGLKIGLPREYFTDAVDPRMAETVREAIRQFEAMGAKVKEVSLPHTDLAIAAYYVIAPAEASANLSRFDGVRYGYRCDAPKDLMDLYTRTRAEGFGAEVKRRIMIGTYSLSAGYYDAYYRKAQQVRRLVRQDFIDALADVDVLMSPVTPSVAFPRGEKNADPVTMYLEDVFTVAVNLAGIPALSIPAGLIDGLPVGLQVIGRPFGEAQLLNVGHQFQQATDWHTRRPD